MEIEAVFHFLTRCFHRNSAANNTTKPAKFHIVEIDPERNGQYRVRVTQQDYMEQWSPGTCWSYDLLKLAEEVVAETTFELLRTERVPYLDILCEFGAKNQRPTVLALLACKFTWSEQAQFAASTHLISEDEVAAVRLEMNDRWVRSGALNRPID